jgi:hypothetical protein
MATREELIDGLNAVIQESRRIAEQLSDADWANVVDLDGWKNQEVLAHVAGTGTLVQPMATGFTSAPAGSDVFASINIDQINAGVVAARAGKSAKDLADEIEATYKGVIEFVKGASDDLMNQRVTVAGYKDVAMSDIMVRMVVLHGLAHIYSVYSSVMMSGMKAN